ncbi:GATA zinc finger domain-containing protein 14-like [Anastrepha ludens]|uniref:GATA zinc finger domain-containing protein 14-like n=1 Tax=Anastrepha ludens TaxID=28586 RepID=UPI0023AE9411|nr:GATA zinc finger domain-containing protein 14-like [Anastrepha ludens]
MIYFMSCRLLDVTVVRVEASSARCYNLVSAYMAHENAAPPEEVGRLVDSPSSLLRQCKTHHLGSSEVNDRVRYTINSNSPAHIKNINRYILLHFVNNTKPPGRSLHSSSHNDINNQHNNNSKHSSSLAHLICSSAVTSKTSTTSQVQNINTISPKEGNKQENLKRHRDGQSSNNSNEQMNSNKKHKNKTQNTVQKTLKEYWLDKPNSSNRFELLAQEAEANELHTDSGTEPKTEPQTEQRKLKPPPSMCKTLKMYKQ